MHLEHIDNYSCLLNDPTRGYGIGIENMLKG